MVGGQLGCRPGVMLGDVPKGTLQLGDTLWVKTPLGTCGERDLSPAHAQEVPSKPPLTRALRDLGRAALVPRVESGGRSGAAPQRGVGPHRHHATFSQGCRQLPPCSGEPSPAGGARGMGSGGAPQEGARCVTGGS